MGLELAGGVRINDGFSPAIKDMIDAMYSLIGSMREMANLTQRSFDDGQVNRMSSSVSNLKRSVNDTGRAIDQNLNQQKQHNNEIGRGNNAYSNMLGTVKSIGVAMGAAVAASKALSLSNQLINDEARLKMMVKDGESVNDLQNKIFQSSIRSSADYGNTLQSITKMGLQAGNAFKNNDQIIAFTENLNKAFSIAGATGGQRDSAIYNLTQALASGVLRGQDFNAVMQSAPNVFDYVADYISKKTGKSADEVRKNIRALAFDGKLSADLIVNSLIGATDEINQKFGEMPYNFENIMTRLNTYAMQAFQPISDIIKNIINAPAFLKVVDAIGAGLIALGNLVGGIADFISAHWDVLRWVFLGIGAIIMGVLIPGIAAFAFAAIKAGIAAAVAFLFAHLPLILIVAAIVLVIIILQKMGITAQMVVENIVGAFFFLGACVANIFLSIYNIVLTILEFIANLVADVVYAISLGWYKVQITAIGAFNGIAQGFANLINGLIEKFEGFLNFFIDGWNGIIDAINGFKISIPDWVPGIGGKTFGMNLQHASRVSLGRVSAPQIGTEGLQAPTRQHYTLERAELLNPFDAFNEGKKVGGDLFKAGSDMLSGLADMLTPQNGNDGGLGDMAALMNDANSSLDDIANSSKDGAGAGRGTKKNTDKLAKDKELSRIRDDLGYLKSMAERRAIINVTWDKLDVSVHNTFGDVHETADLDGWMPSINAALSETINSTVGSAIVS